MLTPNNLHHLALMTGDIKGQIEFFTDVLGMELLGLYNLHGVEKGYHCFLKLGDGATVAFVQIPGSESVEPIWGVSHGAADGAGTAAPGTLHHVSLNVGSFEDLLSMRDRIRSRGIACIGPVDHGCFRSIYFGAPENITMEISTSQGRSLDPAKWIDPEVCEANNISVEDVVRYRSPVSFTSEPGSVVQPEFDETKPRPMGWPVEIFKQLMAMNDEQLEQTIGGEKAPLE